MNSKIVQKCILYACFGLFCYFSGRLFPLGICGETKKNKRHPLLLFTDAVPGLTNWLPPQYLLPVFMKR